MKISVCLATYNGEKYLDEQIKSILTQLNENDELIVSDDNSTDRTVDIINSFYDSRIKLFYNEGPRGYTSNFENALKRANGDIIFLSDQDDVWMNCKVNKMIKKLENADLVVSDVKIVNSNLDIISDSHFKLHNVKKGFIRNFLFTRYIGASMAFKKVVLDRALPFPNKKDLCAHDYWLAIVGEAYYTVEILEVPTLLYRRHDTNVSTGGEKSKNSFWKKVKNRVYSVSILLNRWKIK